MQYQDVFVIIGKMYHGGMPTLQQALASNLRRLRKERRLSQQALGEMCGLSTQMIQKLEKEKTFFGKETIEVLARVLDVPETDLFRDPMRRPSIREALDVLNHAYEEKSTSSSTRRLLRAADKKKTLKKKS